MGKKNDTPYNIEKLKGEKNWLTYREDLKAVLVKERLWEWASGRTKYPTEPLEPTSVGPIAEVTEAQQKEYEKQMKQWKKEVKEFELGHEDAMAVITLTVMPAPREHISGYTNSELAIATLETQYGISDSATVDMALREIFRSNMDNFPSLFEYAEHIRRHYNKILRAGKKLQPWTLSSAFRMACHQALPPMFFR